MTKSLPECKSVTTWREGGEQRRGAEEERKRAAKHMHTFLWPRGQLNKNCLHSPSIYRFEKRNSTQQTSPQDALKPTLTFPPCSTQVPLLRESPPPPDSHFPNNAGSREGGRKPCVLFPLSQRVSDRHPHYPNPEMRTSNVV